MNLTVHALDPDFQESTRTLLADIAAARGQPVPYPTDSLLPSPETSTPSNLVQNTPINYPFNLILTTATIPPSLVTYLDVYHPTLTRLASPNLHRLPSTMKTEYESWMGGNKDADIERRIRKVWAEDSIRPGFYGKLSLSSVIRDQGSNPRSFLGGKRNFQRSLDQGWRRQEHRQQPPLGWSPSNGQL